MPRKPPNYGLSPEYAEECLRELKGLEPPGVVLGLLELCKLAMKRIQELQESEGSMGRGEAVRPK